MDCAVEVEETNKGSEPGEAFTLELLLEDGNVVTGAKTAGAEEGLTGSKSNGLDPVVKEVVV